MPLVIRMSRHGRTNRATFRVGVFDVRTRRNGPPVEPLGWYDPKGKTPETTFHVNAERVAYWFGQGAKPSPTVASFLKRAKIPYPRHLTTRNRRIRDAAKRAAKKA